MFTEHDVATGVARLLQSHGYNALFVGGCVRDKMLGLAPGDFDVATDAPLEFVEEVVTPLAEGAPTRGMNYPVAKFVISGFHIDITSMKNGSLIDDTNRRDFTMNAMYENPVTGQVFDLLDGSSDMARGVLRGIGDVDAHMIDDRRRMLRGPRFAAKLGYEIDGSIWSATRKHAHLIAGLDAKYVMKECRTMVEGPHSHLAMDFVFNTGLIDFIPEEVVAECFPGTCLPCSQQQEAHC